LLVLDYTQERSSIWKGLFVLTPLPNHAVLILFKGFKINEKKKM